MQERGDVGIYCARGDRTSSFSWIVQGGKARGGSRDSGSRTLAPALSNTLTAAAASTAGSSGIVPCLELCSHRSSLRSASCVVFGAPETPVLPPRGSSALLSGAGGLTETHKGRKGRVVGAVSSHAVHAGGAGAQGCFLTQAICTA